ncbi:hypothetical protein BH23ACT9_BH23ACT9_05000 [soil metagenome]
MRSGLGGGLTLFVNVEPDVAATRAPDDLFFTLKHAEQGLRVVLEVTERSLLSRPAELLHWLSWARDRWWGVALDDVGVTSESLALMPFVNPNVIKLDFRFVRQEVLTEDDWRVIDAVHAQADRTGATVLAEGIENAAHAPAGPASWARPSDRAGTSAAPSSAGALGPPNPQLLPLPAEDFASTREGRPALTCSIAKKSPPPPVPLQRS